MHSGVGESCCRRHRYQGRKRLFVLLTLFFSLCRIAPCYAQQQPVAIDSENFNLRVVNQVHYLMDTEKELTFADIRQAYVDAHFQPFQGENLVFGFSDASLWLKLPVRNDLPDAREISMEIRFSTLDKVTFYQVDRNGQITSQTSGDTIPLQNRPYKIRDILFQFILQPGETRTVYIQVETSGAFTIPLYVYTANELIESLSVKNIVDGIYFGIALGLLIYNFSLSLMVRERIYLEYVAFVAAHVITVTCLDGVFALQFIDSTGFFNNVMYGTSILGTAFLYRFSRSYLQTRETMPRTERFLRIINWLLYPAALAVLTLPTKLAAHLNSLFLVVSILIIFPVGVYRFLRGYGPASYFVLGQGALLSAVLFTALSSMFFMHLFHISPMITKFGSGSELLLFSIGIAARISMLKERENLLNRQAQEAQAETRARERYIDEINKINAQLENAVKARSDFLANMSHEIRTPMNGILGMLELVDDSRLDATQRHYVDIARRSGRTLMDLINDILDLSKIEAGKLTLERSDFNLQELLADLSSLYSMQIKGKQLELSVDMADSVPVFINGDRTRLWQILTNLVSNAIKFTPRGSVEISVKSDPEPQPRLRFSVTDTGMGIPADKLESVFESFTQVDGSTTRVHGGTGLGLTITRKLVEMMGGKIQVRSVEGRGSRFYFDIPCVPAQLQSQTAPRQAEKNLLETTDLNALRVLLVEDNVVNQKVAQGILKKIGIVHLDLAENGQEAVELCGKQHYDLVFMDVQMPVMDGYKATQKIREHEREQNARPTLIVAMTAHSMEGDRKLCLDAGMDDYVSKPIRKQALENIIARCGVQVDTRPEISAGSTSR